MNDIQTWEDKYANKLRPAININAETTRNIIGALSSHSFISHGGLIVSYLFRSISKCKRTKQWLTHIDDFLHVIPSRLLTPDDTLNTREMNQKKFTAFHRVDWRYRLLDVQIHAVQVVRLDHVP